VPKAVSGVRCAQSAGCRLIDQSVSVSRRKECRCDHHHIRDAYLKTWRHNCSNLVLLQWVFEHCAKAKTREMVNNSEQVVEGGRHAGMRRCVEGSLPSMTSWHDPTAYSMTSCERVGECERLTTVYPRCVAFAWRFQQARHVPRWSDRVGMHHSIR
jgi:hypothetical protein